MWPRRLLRRFTLTQRVVAAVTGMVAVFVGLQSVLAFVAMHVQEDELTDELLRSEVQQIVQQTGRPGLTPVGAVPASPRVTAYLTRAGQGVEAVPAELRDLSTGLHLVRAQGRELHVDVLDTDDGRLRVVLDASAAEARVDRFGTLLLGIWAVCLVLTAWMARAVAGIAVAPIVEATRSIARWSPEELPRTGDVLDESATLVETFNRFRDKVDETLAREREFAANLDHEIRTPLTTIRTDAELIPLDGPLAAEQRRRLDRITASVDEIIGTTESTLSSSSGRGAPAEPTDLRECVHTACDTMADRAAAKGLRVVVDVAYGATLQLDRQALLTVCRNLVRNAVEHAAPATLVISGGQGGIVFRDDGPGIPAASLGHVFERYQRGHRTDGDDAGPRSRRGLGLAIARRVCDIRGWRLGVTSSQDGPDRGTAFRIDFGDDAGDTSTLTTSPPP